MVTFCRTNDPVLLARIKSPDFRQVGQATGGKPGNWSSHTIAYTFLTELSLHPTSEKFRQ